jgi:hypothetical protein
LFKSEVLVVYTFTFYVITFDYLEFKI